MFCSNCGKEILEGSKFCSNCGEKIKTIISIYNGKDYTNTKYSASMFRGLETINGIITFNNEKMIFKSFPFNIQGETEIIYRTIQSIKFVNVLGLIPTGMNITITGDILYKFIIHDREKIAAYLEYKSKE